MRKTPPAPRHKPTRANQPSEDVNKKLTASCRLTLRTRIPVNQVEKSGDELIVVQLGLQCCEPNLANTEFTNSRRDPMAQLSTARREEHGRSNRRRRQ